MADKKSEFYYPNLLKRLKANDTLMTHNQYMHLYYGYVFQPDFHPYKESDRVEEMKKYYRGDYKESEIVAGIKFFKEELEITPLDLKAMRQLAVMYSKNNDMPTAKKINKNYLAFVDTILTTGDGLKCETGFYVNLSSV
ncbi:DUF4919 domain-containing protein [Chryseobacterium sp.]|uniref:DUF4919 domain-containing protein n=1 Tax=Chryseobacterium sp. TaxID=1871047 RepID=UPI0028A07CD2|nr:DUF4919 domain-containing protein [Chryseobacterium sp.]